MDHETESVTLTETNADMASIRYHINEGHNGCSITHICYKVENICLYDLC